MNKFLVFLNYQGLVLVTREQLPKSWTYEECTEHIQRAFSGIISIQPYDSMTITL
jgi:hypothetical protein